MLFKVLLLQTWYDLGDPAAEDALNDRKSFARFVGLGLDDKAPDHSVIWRFREALTRRGLLETLMNQLADQIDEAGLILRQGTLMDATFVPSAARPPSAPPKDKADKGAKDKKNKDAKDKDAKDKDAKGEDAKGEKNKKAKTAAPETATPAPSPSTQADPTDVLIDDPTDEVEPAAPEVEAPEAENPEAENPEAENPEAENPEAENPEAETKAASPRKTTKKTKPDAPYAEGKRSRVDPDARWAKKGRQAVFGYKLHLSVDAGHRIVRRTKVTEANVNDCEMGPDLVCPDGGDHYADKAYGCEKLQEKLKAHGLGDGIMQRANKHHPLTAAERRRNKLLTPIRSGIEGVFGEGKSRLGLKRAKYFSLKRVQTQCDMFVIAFNMKTLALR